MTSIGDLKTRAGLLLYRQLPEEYRYLDQAQEGELGDLEAFLHGCGHLLDLIRGTTEQAYADAFADETDIASGDEGNAREIQTWLLPYLAELVGAELLAPDPRRRADELNNAVDWFKTKGTLGNIDRVSDTVSGAETVLVEGWRRVLIAPRIDLPPFTAPPPKNREFDPSTENEDGDRLGALLVPLGTPDLRFCNRAVFDPDGTNPLYRLRMQDRNADGIAPEEPRSTYWRPRVPQGAPCFPGAYDDTSLRTPDLRDPEYADVGPHPRRILIHVRPPYGFFEPNLRQVPLPNPFGFEKSNHVQEFDPAAVLKAHGDPHNEHGDLESPVPDKIKVTGDLTIPAGLSVSFENVLFTGKITVNARQGAETRLMLSKCAVRNLALEGTHVRPIVDAKDCLFGEVHGEDRAGAPSGFAQLVHCTVLGETRLKRIWASDCLFAGKLSVADRSESCVRYSGLTDLTELAGSAAEKSPHNTAGNPQFIRLYLDDGKGCVLRKPRFGEPGCGVLDLTTSAAIREGAEDNAEMGAYHHLYHSAQLRAVKLKLQDFLPLGQEIALRYDARLVRPPQASTK